MASVEEQIKEVEAELQKTPKNKSTEKHVALLKIKLAKLRDAQLTASKTGGGSGFGVKKTGDATIAFVGFPSVGKSTLLNALTNAQSPVAAYEFTTLTAIPGALKHKGITLQLVDLPGIIEEASQGRGGGKEILTMARVADLILILLDCKKMEHLKVIKDELYDIGLRLDMQPPNVTVKRMSRGGIKFSTTKKQDLPVKTIKQLYLEFGLINAEIVARENLTPERIADSMAKNRHYVPSLKVINKMDLLTKTELETMKKKHSQAVFISAQNDPEFIVLKDKIVEKLGLMRIYLRAPGKKADVDEPLIIKKGSTILNVCDKLHKELKNQFSFARIWGKHALFEGQKVGINHTLKDETILRIYKK